MGLLSDFKELLEVFNANNVKYLLVGAHAVMYYTEPRYTKDLDLWVEASADNSGKVYRALAKFGAPISELQPADFAAEGHFYQMGVEPARVDILMSISGVAFSAAWKNKVSTKIEGVDVHIIAISDLLAAKKAAGRPEDLLDVERLQLSLNK